MASHIHCASRPVVLGLLLVLVNGCSRGPVKPETLLSVENRALKTTPFTGLPPDAQARTVTLDGRIVLLGSRVTPATAQPGDRVTLTTWWFLKKDMLEDWKIFLHGGGAGGEMNVLQDDHDPLDGLLPLSRWRPGEVMEETRVLRIPLPSAVGQLELRGGFFRGNVRLTVEEPSEHDGQNRVLLATVRVGDGLAVPEYTAGRVTGPLKIDGVADEADWQRAPKTTPFINYDGRGVPSNRTVARLLWDETALYVFFDADDKDIWTSFSKRDDHIYDEEAVEIFLDVDGDLKDNVGTYQELQAAPNDVHFDASFTGRRKGMNPAWNSSYETKAVLRGTFNNPQDVDEGWTSEWRIPWADLVDASGGVKAGQRIRFNMFRLDKPRRNGRVVANEASAWNSPLSGDFHNVNRFGVLILGP